MWDQRCGPPECSEPHRGPARQNPGSRAEPAAGARDSKMPGAREGPTPRRRSRECAGGGSGP
eukprot:13911941-Alexandrium_andersonii.AAC.1